MSINVAVIYYSATGNVHALAEAVAEGALDAARGQGRRLVRIGSALAGAPTRAAS